MPLERFAADQTQRLSCARTLVLSAMVVDDALDTGQAIDSGMDQRAELINQPPLQERAVDRAASLEEQCLDAKDGAELLQRKGKVVALWAGEDVGDAILAQLGQIGIRHLLAQHGDRVIASDIVLAIVDSAGRVDGKVPAIAVSHMRLARDLWSILDDPSVTRCAVHGDVAGDARLGAAVSRWIADALCRRLTDGRSPP
jgi:hypothetical protein